MPIMRAPVCEFQDDENCWNESFEFLFGRDLLVANVLEPGAESRSVYLPKGAKWYAWHDRYRCFEGGQTVEVPVTLGSFPLFIREGAVIPLADSPVLSMERSRVTDLRLLLAPGGPERCYTLYDDDGVSNDYRNGEYRKTEITMSGSPDRTVTVTFRSEGLYRDFTERVTVEMICRERSPLRVALGNQVLERFLNRSRFESAGIGWYYSQTNRAVLIRYPNPDGEYTLTVSFEPQDLIGM
jgi:alpha-glucosidase